MLERRLLLVGEVEVRFEFLDSGMNPVTSAAIGEDLTLQAFVRDAQAIPDGVFRAYFDVNYDPNLATAGATITHGPFYNLAPDGNTSTPGLIDEVGGSDTDTVAPSNPSDEFFLFSVPFTADAAGTLTLSIDDADTPSRTITLFDLTQIAASQVTLVGETIEILAGPVVSIEATTDGNEAGLVGGVFTVNQALATASDTVVAYSVSGTATSGADFTALSGSVTIPAGSMSATINVPTIDEALVEETETVIITLDSITAGDPEVMIDMNNDQASINLFDNDSATISILTTANGNEAGPTDGVFTVTQSAASSTPTTIGYSVIGGTATSGTDFTPLSGTVTIPAGATSAPINVPVLQDNLVEGTESVTLRLQTILSGDPQITIGATNEAALNILDGDTAQVSIAATTDGNETGPVDGVFTVNQSAASNIDTVVSYMVSGSAASGADFTALSGSVTIPAGSTTATISVPTINDDLVEPSETVVVTLGAITAGNTGRISIDTSNDSASIDLIDNDSATLVIAATTNGNETGPVDGQFTVTQSAESTTDTVVSYAVGGTATSGDDFTALAGTVTIPAGSTSAMINVPVIDDMDDEGTETVVVTLGTITAGDADITIDSLANEATIEIADNEVPRVTIAALANGNETGPVNGRFAVNQSIATGTNTVVSYTVSGTATSGDDFTPLSGTVTIPMNSTSATITVPIIDDALIEGIETVVVTITDVSGDPQVVIDTANDEASITIADNDTASLSIAATTDGNETGPVDGVFTINQSVTSTVDTVISYSISGTATPGSDFTAPSGSVTIPAGSTSATITIDVVDDGLVEMDETVIIMLGSITSGNAAQIGIDPGNDAASIDLLDDDAATLSIAATASGDELGPVDGQFTVTQTAESSTDTVISYTVGGTATPGNDYTALAGSVTIPAGSTSATITVPVIDDAEIEGTETVIVTLGTITSGDADISVGAMNEATVQISDDEVPRVGIEVTTNGSEDGPTSGVFTVSQSITTSSDTVVTYAVSGTATSGDDFTALAGTVTIPMNSTSATITVPVIDDALIEGAEDVTLTITDISGDPQLVIDAANDQATATIADNDTAMISVAATTNANEAGPIDGLFTVSQGLASSLDTVISYTVGGTATVGADFTALAGSVTIPAGSTSATITVPVINDAIVEATESITLTLDSITAGNTTQISIDATGDAASIDLLDNDSAMLNVVATMNGNETGPANGLFTVMQTAASSTDTIVNYSVGGTATAGDDYTALAGSVTIPAGSTSATITVPVLDDPTPEGAETVIVTIATITSGDSEITIGAMNQATVEISDDDVPRVGISATTDGDEAGPFEGIFTVSQSIMTNSDTVISYSVSGTASSGDDFTALSGSVTIPTGETSATICVPVIDDELIEGPETVTLMITGFTGDPLLELDVANQQATIEIIDDETGLISIATTAAGDEDGPISGQFTITQDGLSNVDTVIAYTVSGSAAPDQDYTALSGTVTVLAGTTTATIPVSVIDDAVVEMTEAVTVDLEIVTSGSGELAIDSTASSASVFIADNDSAIVSIAATADGEESGPTGGHFTVTQSAVSSVDTVISYTVSGTATPGDDFTSLSGSVTIPAGSTSAVIDVAVIDDGTVEADESVQITLDTITSGNSAISIDQANRAVSLLILDNDSATISIAAGMNAAEQATVDGSFVINQSAPSSTDSVISYSVSGTATEGIDYTALAGTITIPAGQTSVTVVVPVIDNASLEDTESVVVTLTSITASDAEIAINPAAAEDAIEITDDETGLIAISGTTDGNENGLISGAFTVTQDGLTDVDTVLAYTVSGTASSGSDFSALSGTVTIPANQASANIEVTILQDALIEGTESISITLNEITSGDARLVIDAASAQDSIDLLDDDSGTIRIDGTSNGAEQGTVPGVFTVTQDGISTTDTVISFGVTGTANSGSDFTSPGSTVTIPAGTTTATIQVSAIDDAIVEASESVVITLNSIAAGNPAISIDNANRSDSIDIIDNDSATVSISATTDGNESGPMGGSIVVSQSAESSVNTVITLVTGGTASSGDDFTAVGGTVTIPAGATSASVNIAVIDDTLVEGTEIVDVSLGAITSGNSQITIDVNNDDGSLQILDDDSATVAFADASSEALELDGSHSVPVRLTVPGGGQLAQAVTVNVNVTGGTAATPGDFSLSTSTITFPAGSTSGATQIVQLTLVEDQVIEEIETIILGLNLTGGIQNGVTLGAVTSHMINVTDDPMDAVIEGRVWADSNGNGQLDVGELTLRSVPVALSGTTITGDTIELETTTDGQGLYRFTDLPAGTYSIAETQPAGFHDGIDVLGTVNGSSSGSVGEDEFIGVELGPSQVGSGYHFGEHGLHSSQVNRFRILSRPRHGGLFGDALTAEMINGGGSSNAAAGGSSAIAEGEATLASEIVVPPNQAMGEGEASPTDAIADRLARVLANPRNDSSVSDIDEALRAEDDWRGIV